MKNYLQSEEAIINPFFYCFLLVIVLTLAVAQYLMKNQSVIKQSRRKFLLFLLIIIRTVRNNGSKWMEKNTAVQRRQLAYANIIWFATYAGLLLYSVFTAFFTTAPRLLFWGGVLASQILFLTYYFLVKSGKISLSKHWLLLTTYSVVIYFDCLSGNKAFVYLCMFAFLPTALNIFLWPEKKWVIALYYLIPLSYIVATQAFKFSPLTLSASATEHLIYQQAFNLALAFLLFGTFSVYMVFNNAAKQKKLTLQRITLQSTLDNSDSAIWSIDKDFNLTAANSKYISSIEKVFNVKGIKVGVNIRKHELWQKFPSLFKEEYYSVFRGKQVLHEVELDGNVFEIKGVPILDDKNNVHGATFISRNITVKKKAEEALLNAKRMAEEASDAKARFLSNMSHELRTPLNGIIGITRILQEEKTLPEQENHLHTLGDLSEHTLQIVNNILDFAKIEAGKATLDKKRFSLRRLIEKMSSIFQGTARLKELHFEIIQEGETDIYIKGDEVRLSQVLINLIGNAFKFTEKGTVTLLCKAEKQAEEKVKVAFYIRDTGIGIKTESLSKIFESFGQADAKTTRKFGGTGLGLSIGEKILTLMGSSLNVQSEYGKGSEFSFELLFPLSSKLQQQLPADIQESSSSRDLSGMNILLAEDNKVNQIVASRVLKKMNANVSVVSNGKEAFEYDSIDQLSVILMDLDMPVMDGYESTSLIKKKHPATPIIALTAASFDDMHNYLIQKGFDEVVQKPFVPDELLAKICNVAAKHT